MLIKDIREGGSPLETEGVGEHCPGSVHEVEKDFGEKLIATNPFFDVVKTGKKKNKIGGKRT
ncbi:hypothetical protein CMI37_19915 [Candidatus Pacearchaeota archaeon]|nr:hypothetical protein [Candidatus Pacearchaeota archaeon]|tara:strand:- start:633 stop:818 length:186 start_codon:yes stop_codon:yes gene_type:complete